MDSIDIMMQVDLGDNDENTAASPSVLHPAPAASSSAAAETLETGPRVATSRNDATTSSSLYSTSQASVVDQEDADDEEDANADDDVDGEEVANAGEDDYGDDDDDDDEIRDDEDDINEEDRNDEYRGNIDDPSDVTGDDSSEHEREDGDDEESGQLVIAAQSESGVIVVPRGTPMSNVPASAHASVGSKSAFAAVISSVGQLVEASFATPTSVGSDSMTMVANGGSSPRPPITQWQYVAAIAAAPVANTPYSSGHIGSTVKECSDGQSTSSVGGSTARSSTHYSNNKQTQAAQSQRQRQAPVISGYLTLPVVALPQGPIQLRDSYNSQHVPVLPMPFEPGTSVSRASTQLVDLLKRRADTLTQRCLRIQKESLSKATELYELSTRLKTLNMEQCAEEKHQIALFNEYRRIRGVARTAVSILRKEQSLVHARLAQFLAQTASFSLINMADSLIATTRSQLVIADVIDRPSTSLPVCQQPSNIPLVEVDVTSHSMNRLTQELDLD